MGKPSVNFTFAMLSNLFLTERALNAVKLVATSPEFQMPSETAVKAIKTANQLMVWASQLVNREKFDYYFVYQPQCKVANLF